MFGRAQIVVGSDRAPVIPRTAFVERGGLYGAFVLDKSMKAKFRWLRTGQEWPDRIEIKAGLVGGETILAKDDRRVRDGAIIKTVGKSIGDE